MTCLLFVFSFPDRIEELQECLSKLLSTKYKLEELKKHLAYDKLSSSQIEGGLEAINYYVKDIQSRLEVLYKEDGIIKHLMQELGGLETLLNNVDSKSK